MYSDLYTWDEWNVLYTYILCMYVYNILTHTHLYMHRNIHVSVCVSVCVYPGILLYTHILFVYLWLLKCICIKYILCVYTYVSLNAFIKLWRRRWFKNEINSLRELAEPFFWNCIAKFYSLVSVCQKHICALHINQTIKEMRTFLKFYFYINYFAFANILRNHT